MMKRRLLFLAFLGCLLAAVPALAQQKPPRIGYFYPAGIQRGTAAEITVGGQYLEGAAEILFTGAGLKATLVRTEKPLNGKRENELRDYLREARKKAEEAKERNLGRFDRAEIITATLKDFGVADDEIRMFLLQRKQRGDPKRQQNVQLSETALFRVEAAPDAPAGPREARLRGSSGISNPLAFCVGTLAETRKPEGGTGKMPEEAPLLSLPTVVNGQIPPGGVDRYAFTAPRGARIVAAVQARDLIPYLADAVPGWFQPVVAISDAKGREVAYSGAFRFNPDPALCFDVPETGSYLLEIRDALYRGREDFVYRVTLGAVPFITGVFPLGAPAGEAAVVDVSGWNLQRGRMIVAPSRQEGVRHPAELGNGFSIADPAFAADALPEVTEAEPNDTPPKAQALKLPLIVNGRIDKPGEVDQFSFEGKAGEKLVADVAARRLNSPLDSWLRVTAADGRQIAFNDDQEDKAAGLLTHQADSHVEFTLPAGGVYRLQIGDTQRKGGPEYAYRLRVGPPRPDFALRWVPSALNGRPGMSLPVTVYAVRKDGFAGEIVLNLKEAPPGFHLQGGIIPPGQEKVQATLTFPPDPLEAPVALTVEGQAVAGGRELRRPAVPADDLLQAFAYHHLVPAQTMLAATSGTSRVPPLRLAGTQPLVLQPGGSGQVVVARNGRLPRAASELKLQLFDPPEGISIGEVTTLPDGSMALTVQAASSVKPGFACNLLLEAFVERTPPVPEGKKPEKRRWSIGVLPAIPLRVEK